MLIFFNQIKKIILESPYKQLNVFINLRRKYIRLISKKFDDFIEQDISSICITRDDGTIFKVNSNFESLFGYEKDEIIGHNLRGVISENFKEVLENLINGNNYLIDSKIDGKQEVEVEGLKRNGELFPIMVRLSKITILGENYISLILIHTLVHF